MRWSSKGNTTGFPRRRGPGYAALRNELSVNYLIFRMQWPGMGQEQVLRQIELMGSEVIPRVKGEGWHIASISKSPDLLQTAVLD